MKRVLCWILWALFGSTMPFAAHSQADIPLCTSGMPAANVYVEPWITTGTSCLQVPTGGGTVSGVWATFTGSNTFGLNCFAYGTIKITLYNTSGAVVYSGTLRGDHGFTNHANLTTALTSTSLYCVYISLDNSLVASILGDATMALTTDLFGNARSWGQHAGAGPIPAFTRQTWTANAHHCNPNAGYVMPISQDGMHTLQPGFQFNGLKIVGSNGGLDNVAKAGFLSFNGGVGAGNYFASVGAQLMEFEVSAKSDQLWVYMYDAPSAFTVVIDGVRRRYLSPGKSGTWRWVQVAGYGADGYNSSTQHEVRLRLASSAAYGLSVAAFMLTNNDGTNGTLGTCPRRKLLVAAGDSITYGELLNSGIREDGSLSYISDLMDHFGWQATVVAVSGTKAVDTWNIPMKSTHYGNYQPHPYNWGSGDNSAMEVFQKLAAVCHTGAVYPDWIIGAWGTNDCNQLDVQIPANIFQTAISSALQNLLTGPSGTDLSSHLSGGVVLLGPLSRATGNPVTSAAIYTDGSPVNQFPDYMAAIRASVAAFGNPQVKALDQWSALPDTTKTYLIDGIHPNALGAVFQAKNLIHFFETLPK